MNFDHLYNKFLFLICDNIAFLNFIQRTQFLPPQTGDISKYADQYGFVLHSKKTLLGNRHLSI